MFEDKNNLSENQVLETPTAEAADLDMALENHIPDPENITNESEESKTVVTTAKGKKKKTSTRIDKLFLYWTSTISRK